MPANNTNQSALRRVQGGSPTSRGQNERSQRATRTAPPNTAYNSSQGSNNMFSQYAGQNYNPWGTNPAMGQYGNQQQNLGRYRPPTMSGGNWADGGGYAYNLPNAYGGTGLNYMSGFGQLQDVFNPFIGNQAPNSVGGMFGSGTNERDAQMQQPGQRGARGMFGNMQNALGFGGAVNPSDYAPMTNSLADWIGGSTPPRSNVDPSMGNGRQNGRMEITNVPQTTYPTSSPNPQVGNATQPPSSRRFAFGW